MTCKDNIAAYEKRTLPHRPRTEKSRYSIYASMAGFIGYKMVIYCRRAGEDCIILRLTILQYEA